jgi:hypothetical protein
MDLDFRSSSFYSKYKKIIVPVLGVALFVGGYFAGRVGNPEKIVIRDRIEEVIVEKVVWKENVVERRIYVEAKREKTRKETTTTKAPDGTETTKTVEETQTDTDKNENNEKVVEKIVEKEVVVERVVEKEKLVFGKNGDWRVAAGLGVSIPTLLGKPEMGIPGLQGAVIQLEIDRRVVGHFYMGLFGNSQGAAGLTISGVF